MDFAAISSLGVPILCIDTCSILDIMRDPTRDGARAYERQAAIDLVKEAEAGRLICIIAEQVDMEFADHDQPVQETAERELERLRNKIKRVNEIAAVFGSQSTVNLAHLDDHVKRTRAVVGRWLKELKLQVPSANALIRAFKRSTSGIAPATQAKKSVEDCLIYETYLEAATAFQNTGQTLPIVFLSSNTKEYQGMGRILKPEIDAEFSELKMTYAPNMAAAKSQLGF